MLASENPIHIAGRFPALAGAIWGIICALVLGVLRFVAGDMPFGAVLVGNIAFAAVYLAPFILALLALGWQESTRRATAWLAASILALLAAGTAFSGVSLIFLPAAVMLTIAAAAALLTTKLKQVPLVIVASLLLVATGAAAWLLLLLRQDPHCWQLVQMSNGRQVWQAVPFSNSGSQPAVPVGGSDILSGICASDITSPLEGALSISLLLIAALGLWLLSSRSPLRFLKNEV